MYIVTTIEQCPKKFNATRFSKITLNAIVLWMYGRKTLYKGKKIPSSSDTVYPDNIKWFEQFSIKMFPQWTTINVSTISIK